MIPTEVLNRLITQAIRHRKWYCVGDLLFLRDTQEMQALIWDTTAEIERLRNPQ